MTPCRLYCAAVALSLAFGALVTLAVCNRVLQALEDERGKARKTLEGELDVGALLATMPDDPDGVLRSRILGGLN